MSRRPTVPSTALGLSRAIARLRGPSTRHELCEVAADALTRTLGFDRGFVICTAEAAPVLVSASVPGDAVAQDELRAAARHAVPALAAMTVEREALRTRRGILGEAEHSSLVPVRHGAYAVAPIVEDGRPIGVLHADTDRSLLPLGPEDVLFLEAFASAVGLAFERASALHRAKRLSQAARATAAALEAVADGALKPATRLLEDVTGHDGPALGRLGDLLTRRELEVLELVAAGAKNAEIASQLVLSEGTIKSHVKTILRKMHVANRAQAAAKYTRMASVR